MSIVGGQQLHEILARLRPDAWRRDHPFSAGLRDANSALWASRATQDEKEKALSKWIATEQPCVFGREAAKHDLITYCIVGPREIAAGDDAVLDFIQRRRMEWQRNAFAGKTNGFIVLCVDERLASAEPGPELMQFAKRLAYLYLMRTIEADRIDHDEISLRIPSEPDAVVQWKAGVNVFGAQGDGRWWNDHRIPGGLGFSVNSVGHLSELVKRATVLKSLPDIFTAMLERPNGAPTSIKSLDTALAVAMITISKASNTVSGPATSLLERQGETATEDERRAAASLPGGLANKEFRVYEGYYHTDWTIPEVYFRPDVERPRDAEKITLDFTYLFNSDIENIDFYTMGRGRHLRAGQIAFSTRDGRWSAVCLAVDTGSATARCCNRRCAGFRRAGLGGAFHDVGPPFRVGVPFVPVPEC